MMKKRRKVPDWMTNVSIVAFFIFCYLIIYCKVVALGYRVSELEKNYQQMKSWNQYYRSQILKELSLEKVKQRAEKMNLSLGIPETWRILSLTETETENFRRDNNAHAAESE